MDIIRIQYGRNSMTWALKLLDATLTVPVLDTVDGYGCFLVVFYGCFFGNRGSRRKMLQNSVSYCRAKPLKASASAPRPRKKGRFGVAISERPPSPSWDPRLPETAPEHYTDRASQYASDTVRISDVRASRWGGVCE